MPEYAEFEKKMMKVIWQALGLSKLTVEERDIVKEIDSTLLYYEFLNLHGSKVFNKQPTILSTPDYSEKHFKTVKNTFLSIYKRLTANSDSTKYIGIDGCSKGWICAVITDNYIEIERFDSISDFMALSKELKCAIDDIIDAICLAVTASLSEKGKVQTLPHNPDIDETGLLMQMIIPKI